MLLDLIEKRKSGRAFSEKPVSDEALESILEAGRKAPSCGNTQAWDFVVIKDPEVRAQANTAMSRGNYWAERAAVMILVASRPESGCPAHGQPYYMMDVGLAVENMLLQTVHLGLMGHPTAGWKEDNLKELTGIPDDYRIAAVVFIGHEGSPDHLDEKNKEREKTRTPRKALDEIVHYDTW